MYASKGFKILISFVLLGVWLVGCTSRGDKAEGSSTGLANPASVYCQGLGYREETRENESGQYGVCIFPDGSECDTWDFLAGRCGQVHTYCVSQGYEIQSEKDKSIATCLFDDGSSCTEILFFEGECQPGER